MDKATLMAVCTLIKFISGLIGIVLTMILLLMALIKKDNKRLKQAVLIFLATFSLLIIFTVVEFLFLS